MSTAEGSAPDVAALDALPTEELRQRAFARARQRVDLRFFWSVIQHLPHAAAVEDLDGSLGAYGATVDDAVAMWREFHGHGYGASEPLLRAAFIEYLRGGDPG
ncbi:hypothetical protein GCM10010123_29310 [Pilimelia anulata]|uniref:Uncharacterized protein n=1 Tax=Pilimelia anulata TaxID=53371 RepID=A0A8J3B5Q7_9ACTN|nr:hypothetical protein [Pilimelia anulata]GGJ97415.1 hypothetical protein GCM10010123_29310 [Pilimelia anulata]